MVFLRFLALLPILTLPALAKKCGGDHHSRCVPSGFSCNSTGKGTCPAGKFCCALLNGPCPADKYCMKPGQCNALTSGTPMPHLHCDHQQPAGQECCYIPLLKTNCPDGDGIHMCGVYETECVPAGRKGAESQYTCGMGPESCCYVHDHDHKEHNNKTTTKS